MIIVELTHFIYNETSSFNNCIVVKFCLEGFLSLQQTGGMYAYSSHLSSSERGKMAGLLSNNS